MNRIMTALALSGLFVAAPAFAKTHANKPVASAGDKAVAGDKGSSETKTTETKTEGSSETAAKPAKKTKKTKKVEKTEGSSEKPAEAPAK